ncbi:uncharacterized protein LOC107480083 [Arachis duranensis]|uniref:Uncharacterized protein LOC107480083 n=1 Tax=Arachis duranensis TaxID=130453 RepID=A0A6P4CQL7_ARADU|nr:uncharacterized protein LOC107480083 [Arachis duranensis]
MVLQDSKGSRMHASVYTAIVKKWSHVITEFQMYTMSNFVVLHDLMESNIPCVGVLQNVRNNHINCILFGDLVDHILPHIEDGRVEPLIVVFQYFKAYRWNGTMSMQSHFYVSKLHFDPEIKEVVVFRSRMLCGAPSNSPRISQTNTDVNKLPMESPVWIAATVVSINASKSDWYYKSCRRCPKKIETPIGKRYECTKCGHTHGCAAIRYKLEVMVCDGTRSMTLLLWDRETTQLTGKIAEKVVDEEAIFKINVKMANIKQYDQVYTVIKKNGYSNLVDMSGHVVNLKTDTDPHFSMDGLEDSVSSGKYKTPAISASNGINDVAKNLSQHEEKGQFFTNRFSRRAAKKAEDSVN